MITGLTPASVSPRSSAWALPVGLSVVVHGAIVATAMFVANLVTRPTPPPVVAVEVVFASSGKGAPGAAKPAAGGVDGGAERPIAQPAVDPPPVPPPAENAAGRPPTDPVPEVDSSSRPPVIEPSVEAIEVDRPARRTPPLPAALSADPPSDPEPSPEPEVMADPLAPTDTSRDRSPPWIATALSDQSRAAPVAAIPRNEEARKPPEPLRSAPTAGIAATTADGSPVAPVAGLAPPEVVRDPGRVEPTEARRPPRPPPPPPRAVRAPRAKPRRPPPMPRPRAARWRAASVAERALPPTPRPAVSNPTSQAAPASPATTQPRLAALTTGAADKPSPGDGAGSTGPAADVGNRPPEYPLRARRRGWQGRVVLRVRVAITGEALSVEVKESSGRRLLDRAAAEAVRNWRFSPGRLVGVPVIAAVDVPIVFKLE